jgi:hypothetical protein
MERGSQVIWGSLCQSAFIEISDLRVPLLTESSSREEFLSIHVHYSCHSALQTKNRAFVWWGGGRTKQERRWKFNYLVYLQYRTPNFLQNVNTMSVNRTRQMVSTTISARKSSPAASVKKCRTKMCGDVVLGCSMLQLVFVMCKSQMSSECVVQCRFGMPDCRAACPDILGLRRKPTRTSFTLITYLSVTMCWSTHCY